MPVLPARFAAPTAATPATWPATAAPTSTAGASATTPATTSAATEAVASTTGAAPKTPVRLGPGFIDVQRPAIHGVSVERRNRLVGLGFVFHFNKCEPARPAGVTICHNSGAVDRAVLFEQGPYCLFGNVEIQVADEDVFHSNPPVNLKAAHRLKAAHGEGSTKRKLQNALGRIRESLSNAISTITWEEAGSKQFRGIGGA
jgi:hypothetical protein